SGDNCSQNSILRNNSSSNKNPLRFQDDGGMMKSPSQQVRVEEPSPEATIPPSSVSFAHYEPPEDYRQPSKNYYQQPIKMPDASTGYGRRNLIEGANSGVPQVPVRNPKHIPMPQAPPIRNPNPPLPGRRPNLPPIETNMKRFNNP